MMQISLLSKHDDVWLFLINELLGFSHAYRSLKQTLGSTSCPWTTILVLHCGYILNLEFILSVLLNI